MIIFIFTQEEGSSWQRQYLKLDWIKKNKGKKLIDGRLLHGRGLQILFCILSGSKVSAAMKVQ